MKKLISMLALLCLLCCALPAEAPAGMVQDSTLNLVGAWTTGHCNAVSVDSDLVFVARGSTLEILRVSGNGTLASAGRLLGNAMIIQIALSGSAAYLVREYWGWNSTYRLSIIDVSHPEAPVETASYDLGDAFHYDHRICARGEYVLVPFSRLFNQWHSWLVILDVSDPANPREAGRSAEFEGVAVSVHVSGDFAYISVPGFPTSDVRVFSIDDPSNPYEVGSAEGVPRVRYIKGNSLYAADGDSLVVFDITTPSTPARMGTCVLSPFIQQVVVSGSVAYVTRDSLLSVVDVADPRNPHRIAEVPFGDASRDLRLTGRRLYLAGLWAGLQVFDVADSLHPVHAATYWTGRSTWDCSVCRNVVVVTHQEGGLSVVDVTDPSNPEMLAFNELEIREAKVHAEGQYAYLVGASADWLTSYFVVVDIADPSHPREIGRLDLGEWASDVWVADHIAYVVLHSGGLKTINASDPSHPVEVGFCQMMNAGNSVFVQGHRAYVVGGPGSGWAGPGPAWLCVIAIDDVSRPFVLGSFDGGGGGYRRVFVSGNRAFVAGSWWNDIGGGSWLDVVDISSDVSPGRACESYRCDIGDLLVMDEQVYCATGGGGIGVDVLDVSDLSRIHSVARFPSTPARAVTTLDGMILLLANDGLYFLEDKSPTVVTPPGALPSSFSLSQNYPNPFNPGTTITYGLPRPSMVRLSVFDLLGREVAVLVNEREDAGIHEVEFDASALASGVYLYRLQVRPLDSAIGRDSRSGTGDFTQTKRLLLLR